MKQKLRLISLLMTVIVVLGSLTSCRTVAPGIPHTTTPIANPNAQSGKNELSYTLTQSDVDAMYETISECEHLFLNCAPTEEQLLDAIEDIDSGMNHISTQAQLAYIQYCLDQESDETAEAYLFATSAQSDCYERYIEMCRKIDESSSPNREFFFRDWTDEEFEIIRGYSTEMNQISQDNNELLVQYRGLSDAAFMNGAASCYLQMIRNNNRLAELNGYDHYWDYAYDMYNRDYGADEMETMRNYIRQYLPSLLVEVVRTFGTLTASLSQSEWQTAVSLLELDYEELPTDYLASYTASYMPDVYADMQSLFDPENSFFTDSDSSFAGAFTVWLSEPERPVCYFGPGYQDLFTVVHEMGHYYAFLSNPGSTAVLDLAEVHSQGNEWMLMASLEDTLSPNVAEMVFLNQLGGALTTIILCAAVDDFEQRCYTTDPRSVEDLNEIAADVVADYGGEEWFSYYITDFSVYWRRVVVENPGYYISYAVSMLAALQIYCVAEQQSYAAGQAVFLRLVESDPAASFTEALQDAGLDSPLTDASVYEAICRLME